MAREDWVGMMAECPASDAGHHWHTTSTVKGRDSEHMIEMTCLHCFSRTTHRDIMDYGPLTDEDINP